MQPGTQAARERQDRTRMKAIVQDVYGATEVLRTGEVDVPQIGTTDVLVQVRAAGLDRGAWHLMTGQPYLMRLTGFGVRRPKNPVPGMEVARVVAAVGTDVTRFSPGDEVFGIARGSFAEYAAVGEGKLARKPARRAAGLSMFATGAADPPPAAAAVGARGPVRRRRDYAPNTAASSAGATTSSWS